jgi:hypothetical protein
MKMCYAALQLFGKPLSQRYFTALIIGQVPSCTETVPPPLFQLENIPKPTQLG